jgi:hypothetical protein
MTDWIQGIKREIGANRQRTSTNRRAVEKYWHSLWQRIAAFSSLFVDEFNAGTDYVTMDQNDRDFTVKARSRSPEVTVLVDLERELIRYEYIDVPNRKSDQFYIEADPSGQVLHLCLEMGCKQPIKEEDAVRRILEPLFQTFV